MAGKPGRLVLVLAAAATSLYVATRCGDVTLAYAGVAPARGWAAAAGGRHRDGAALEVARRRESVACYSELDRPGPQRLVCRRLRFRLRPAVLRDPQHRRAGLKTRAVRQGEGGEQGDPFMPTLDTLAHRCLLP